MNATPLWTPSEDFLADANLRRFEAWLAEHRGVSFDDYEAFWKCSVEHVADFWEAVWQYFEVIAHTPYRAVLTGETMPDVRWFEGATLN